MILDASAIEKLWEKISPLNRDILGHECDVAFGAWLRLRLAIAAIGQPRKTCDIIILMGARRVEISPTYLRPDFND